MSNNINQDADQQIDSTSLKRDSNEKSTSEMTLTFKDWKSLKCQQNKDNSNEKSQNNRSNCGSDSTYNNSNNYYKNNSFNEHAISGFSNFFGGYNGQSGYMPYSNFNRGNSNFGPVNNGFNNFNGPNNFNASNKFGGVNFNNSYNNSVGLSTISNPIVSTILARGNNNANGLNGGNNLNLPESFFFSDGIYRQKDFMQKPLPNYNPFRNEEKANNLIKEFDKARYSKNDKKKKGNKTAAAKDDINKSCSEPKVYVPNPKAKSGDKPYIPKPKLPEVNLEISKEEKKQQWKEYREAMKPFKNREFHNAKRVVQRLGKKNLSELDEKQIIRLTKAREFVEDYKASLSVKYANYIKVEENPDNLGELYLLKKKPLLNCENTKQYQNSGNFGEIQTSDATKSIINSESTGYSRFISGGILDVTI